MESLALNGNGVLWILPSQVFAYHGGAVVSGGAACLLDPGILPDEIDQLARHVNELGTTKISIILTHAHWDHILGPERLPGCEVVAHAAFPRGDSDLRTRRVANQVKKWRDEQGIEADGPFALPHPEEVFERILDISVGDVPIRLIHAPGHSEDHSVVFFPDDHILWAADMLSDDEIPYVGQSLLTYSRALEALSALQTDVLIPTHGAMTDDASEIRQRFDADRTYLDELRQRTEKAVEAGCTVEEAVQRCSTMVYANPDLNRRAHELNAEHAYCELGGEADPASLGWNRLHQ